MGNFKPGAAALCISRDVPAVPVAIVGASEAMPYGQSWPHKGRMPVHVAFGEPMWAEDGETAAQFSTRMAKEVRGLVDYTTTYRAERS
jgi:1-acyl-sn-glycerol-3-phosphate acyltransferase